MKNTIATFEITGDNDLLSYAIHIINTLQFANEVKIIAKHKQTLCISKYKTNEEREQNIIKNYKLDEYQQIQKANNNKLFKTIINDTINESVDIHQLMFMLNDIYIHDVLIDVLSIITKTYPKL